MKLRVFDLEILAAIERSSTRPSVMNPESPKIFPRDVCIADIGYEVIGPKGTCGRWSGFGKLLACLGSALDNLDSSAFVTRRDAGWRLTFNGQTALDKAKSAQS